MNRRIWAWFDDGKLNEALRGDGDFFVPEITYRDEHDLILIVGQLFAWAKERGCEREAAGAFERVVAEYALAGDVLHAAHLVLTYLIIASEREETIGVRLENVAASVATSVMQHPEAVVGDEGTRTLILSVADRLPELQRLLQLGIETKLVHSSHEES